MGFQQYCQSLFHHHHHSDRWRHHLVACLVLWKLVSLDVKWHFLLFLLRILPYFRGRTGKRGKCPYAPSILSGRNGHILRKPSVPYHCLPRNQEFHTFYLNLADFVKHTLKGALQVSLFVLCQRHLAELQFFFPDPVNQTLLGNLVSWKTDCKQFSTT